MERINNMKEWKRKKIYDILLSPICCTKHSGFDENKKVTIKIENEIIETTQSYYPQYTDKRTGKPFRYDFKPDCDMSDFACGFYEILYKDILANGKIVESDGNFVNRQFAGDVMNSVSKLTQLEDKYHCLANFWLAPMHIGRTSNTTPSENKKWSKVSDIYNIADFMDRFLLLLKYNFDEIYRKQYTKYFGECMNFEVFCKTHILVGSYVDQAYDVKEFSHKIDVNTSETVYELIKQRAKEISESRYACELWDYFKKYKLVEEYVETYLEADEYSLNEDKYPYAYECPKCNRIITNEQNYSIPPICDECSCLD